jgi:hypothetical protein
LKSQLKEVYFSLKKGEYDDALGSLKAFRKHVKAQAGKHISSEAAERLIYLANKLRESIISFYPTTEKHDLKKELPEGFELLQNYPNPFNPQTEIAYTLPEGSNVKLEIYNVLGQKVKVLVDEYQSAGTKKVVWDGKNENGERVSSGIYFYRLDAGSYVQTKKMSLLK